MRIEQEKVALFHERNHVEVSTRPTLLPQRLAEQRHAFLAEENDEYVEAQAAGDLVGVADALADAVYIILGTAVSHGIDLQPIFNEVHRSNMTKTPLDPVTRKGGKGEGYQPPRLAELLFMMAKLPDEPISADCCDECFCLRPMHRVDCSKGPGAIADWKARGL